MSFIKVLIVDDNNDYIKPQIDLANNFEIDLFHYPTWEDAQIELNRNFEKYQAVILDGKGQLNQDSKIDDPKHVTTAINWIKEQRGRGNCIYYVINTGYYDDIETFFGQEIIYDKSKGQEEQMFLEIRNAVSNIAKIKYPDVYEIFENGLLPNSETKADYERLVEILTYGDLSDKSGICTIIRKIQESLYKHLNAFDNTILPNECFKPNGMLNFNQAKNYLSGRKNASDTEKFKEDVQGSDIENLSRMIYWISGNTIHHKNKEERPYNISLYALKALFFALNEQLLWYKKLRASI